MYVILLKTQILENFYTLTNRTSLSTYTFVALFAELVTTHRCHLLQKNCLLQHGAVMRSSCALHKQSNQHIIIYLTLEYKYLEHNLHTFLPI